MFLLILIAKPDQTLIWFGFNELLGLDKDPLSVWF